MIKMEVLYPEYMNLYGDNGNVRYLEKIIPNLKIINTHLNDQPKFLNQKIDVLYLGPATEKRQIEIIKKLLPHRDKLKALIEKKTLIIATGNAIEYFGKYIQTNENDLIPCLNLYDVYAKRFPLVRYNDNVICPLEGFTVVGFKNQRSHLYGNDKHALKVPIDKNYLNFLIDKNLFATYLIGPVLALNPMLTETLLKKANIPYKKPPFYDVAIKAYQKRVIEFNQTKKA